MLGKRVQGVCRGDGRGDQDGSGGRDEAPTQDKWGEHVRGVHHGETATRVSVIRLNFIQKELKIMWWSVLAILTRLFREMGKPRKKKVMGQLRHRLLEKVLYG